MAKGIPVIRQTLGFDRTLMREVLMRIKDSRLTRDQVEVLGCMVGPVTMSIECLQEPNVLRQFSQRSLAVARGMLWIPTNWQTHAPPQGIECIEVKQLANTRYFNKAKSKKMQLSLALTVNL